MPSWLALGALSAAISVAFGAFGAHGLKERVSVERLAAFETGARYHFYHSLALIALHAVRPSSPSLSATAAAFDQAGSLLLGGTVLFSGSLYALVLLDQRRLGAITPIGGTALIAGWLRLAVAAW